MRSLWHPRARDDEPMGTSEHREVERKYEIDAGTGLPDLTTVEGVTSVGDPALHDLEATYFDTEALDLLRHGVTLRRRTGGGDAGWHLKLPEGDDARLEVRMPLDAGIGAPAAAPPAAPPEASSEASSETSSETPSETPPDALLEPVRAIVRDRPVRPIARLSTHRVERALLDEHGIELAQVSDDTVTAERLGSPTSPTSPPSPTSPTSPTSPSAAPLQHWREVEAELVKGSPDLLERIDEALTAAGCTPATVGSKVARAMGETAYGTLGGGATRTKRRSRKEAARGPVRDLVRVFLAEQVDDLLVHDRGVRREEAESVHRMRIAARRMRSALVSYGPVFVPGSVDDVREELRWLGQSLSQARDAKVLRAHLDEVVADEPSALVVGPVSDRIGKALAAEHEAGMASGLEALRSSRYYRLLDTLDELVASPPVTGRADEPASHVVPDLLRRDAKRLRRAVREMRDAPPEEHDPALHEARKKAKRYRYAAESAVPALGKPAKKLAKKAKRVQDALGEHQDAVVARRVLRGYAGEAHLAGESSFTYGRLHALEQQRASAAEEDFERAWAKLPRTHLRRALRR